MVLIDFLCGYPMSKNIHNQRFMSLVVNGYNLSFISYIGLYILAGELDFGKACK